MAKRQLSAIMFTDLAGYTAMVQKDEYNAKGIRDHHRNILETEVSHSQGTILQFFGDGALSIFGSTIDAANAALAIQKASIVNNIPLRIGIHSGDVVVEDDGVFGDGVNVASRIESFSVPGSIMISGKVHDDIKNHLSFKALLMGEFELKNVVKPIEIYALTNDGLVVPRRNELKGKVKERIKSVAVLPFINRSADPENEYFSDGITEEIISALAKVEDIRVISRASSFSLKGKSMDVREIGKILKVQSVLDGSVRKSGNRIRIATQLSSTFDGYELWTETYDRLLEDIFEVQDEISQHITEQLKIKLSNDVEETENHKNTNVEAYNNYLKGLFHYNKWTPDSASKSLPFFEKAISLDPAYDKAYTGIALAYSLMSTTGYLKPSEGYSKCEQACQKAIEINPNCESAMTVLSYIEFFFKWNFKKARAYTEKALSINPNSSDANTAYALYFTIFGQPDKGVEHIYKALEIDPLSLLVNRTLGDVHYFMRNYEEAIKKYDLLLDMDPSFAAAREFKAWALLMSEQYDQAIEIFESILGNTVHAIKPYVQLAYAYSLKGHHQQSEEAIDRLKIENTKKPEETFDLNMALLFTGLRKPEEALVHVKNFCEAKIGSAIFLSVSPMWDPIREHPEFRRLEIAIGLKTA